MNKILFLTVILCAMTVVAHAQQMQLEIIPLNHRPVDEVISVIKPILTPGGTITGMNNQLIVKTTPENLEEIRQILASIDRPLRRLMISVRQDRDDRSVTRQHSLSGSVSSGDVSLSNRTTPTRGGVVISGTDSDGNRITYKGQQTNSNRMGDNTYTVQTLDGQPAFIQTGQSVPVPSQSTVVTGRGVIVQDSVEYRDVVSGFYVMPRINGEYVTMVIAPQMSEVRPGHGLSFDVQNVQTTITAKLGEWVEIGGIDQVRQSSSTGILSSRQDQQQQQRGVLLKVDEIP